MRPQTRVLLMVAALLMALAYVAPLWQISLEAPQYPEGLGMSIWISTITGQQPNDLNSINNLNHYIGMKAIVPDAIPGERVRIRLTDVGRASFWRGEVLEVLRSSPHRRPPRSPTSPTAA